jgi:uncharacterized membrane protein YtjA (UPF0391 family)
MSPLFLVLIVLLVVVLFGGLPRWGYHSYGWGPSGIVGVLLVILVVWLLLGHR